MKKHTRAEQILDYLYENNVATIKQLSEFLNVSEMTVRRDIESLKENSDITTFFGGVSLNQANNRVLTSYEYEEESCQYLEQKNRIAQKAASLIKPNDAIFIDAGSTTGQIVKYLSAQNNIMVYSHSLAIINDVCDMDQIKLIGFCGYYHKNTKTFESAEAVQLLNRSSINLAFLSARGVSEHGITTAETYELDIKKAAIESSKTKILLIDSSKFGKTWYANYAKLSDIDIIITDNDIPEEFVTLIRSQGIILHIV